MNDKLFYVVAAGPSYMDVTEEEWKYLEDKNTITFSRVPYGSRKFKYYLSIERDYLDREVLQYMASLGYLDTKLMLSITKSLYLAKSLGFKNIKQIIKQNFYFMPSRQPWFTDEEKPPHTFYESRANGFRQPLFRFRGQLSAVINACIILGADEIRLIGVDMNNQKNFYQYPEYLKKVCKDEGTINRYIEHDSIAHNKGMKDMNKLYNSFDENTMHSINAPITEDRWNGRTLRGMADVLEWIDNELKSEGMKGIYVCSKDSILYKQDKLEYRSIMDEDS